MRWTAGKNLTTASRCRPPPPRGRRRARRRPAGKPPRKSPATAGSPRLPPASAAEETQSRQAVLLAAAGHEHPDPCRWPFFDVIGLRRRKTTVRFQPGGRQCPDATRDGLGDTRRTAKPGAGWGSRADQCRTLRRDARGSSLQAVRRRLPSAVAASFDGEDENRSLP